MIKLTNLFRIHQGHVGRVLNKWRNSQPWLDENIYDISSGIDPSLRKIRLHKDSLSREIINAENDIKNLFSDEQIKTLLGESHRESEECNVEKELQVTKDVLKILRVFRPNAQPSYRESSASYLDKTAKKLIKSHTKSEQDDHEFTSKSFIFSILALCNSLKQDIQQLLSDISGKSYVINSNESNPFALRDVIKKLFDSVSFKKNSQDVKRWSNEIWPNISKYFNIPHSAQEMENWLQSHISRINLNSGKFLENEYYNIANDFTKDSYITNETLEEENAMGIPRQKYKLYFKSLLDVLNHNMNNEQVDHLCYLFEQFLITLEDLGLNKWLVNEVVLDALEPLPDFSILGDCDNECIYEARQIIKHLARGCPDLLKSFPSPFDFIQTNEKLVEPENPFFTDKEINELFDYNINIAPPLNGVKDAPFDLFYENHLRFHRNLGPAEHFVNDKNELDWKWKAPGGAIFDHNRQMYLRSNRGIDPLLRLEKMRCVIVDRRHTLSMSKAGRMYFTRCVVAVGDGKGYFGMGVGHGPNIADARNDGILNALKDMYFVDFDKKMPLLTPVRGQEYGTTITITPRPLGKGLRVSGRYLGLAYLTGLDDCKISFSGTRSWITRMRALRRALEQIYSRQTMANATGMKYTNLFCPGDHTIHWPDKWFIPILNEYKKRIGKIKRHRLLSARKAVRRHMAEITPTDLKPEQPRYAYKSPLQRWQNELTQLRYTSKVQLKVQQIGGIKQLPDNDSVSMICEQIDESEDQLNFPIEDLVKELNE